MTRSVAKISRVAGQCDVNLHSPTRPISYGRFRPVVKVTNSWLVCTSTFEVPPCRTAVHVKYAEAQTPPLGVVWKLGVKCGSSGAVLVT
ncbi:hypothetical protein TNCV_4428461 [Trichonephila clavipes]|nr:hypothetical protein TNCV_4428461 [Trichonephila clavipes]